MNKTLALLLVRWIIALTLIGKGALLLLRSASGGAGGYAGAAAYGLFAFALLIAGVLLVARDVVPWLTAPLWRFLTGIVFPDDKFDRPPVNYALPRAYRQRGRREDAIAEYLKIIRHHPREVAAYVECIEVMIEAGDTAGAEKVRRRGRWRLGTPEGREALEGAGRQAGVTSPE